MKITRHYPAISGSHSNQADCHNHYHHYRCNEYFRNESKAVLEPSSDLSTSSVTELGKLEPMSINYNLWRTYNVIHRDCN